MAQHTPHVPPTKADLASARKTAKSATGAQHGIVDNIEKKLGPVGPGKHNDIRTQALLDWLRKNPAPKKDSEANDTPAHERSESMREKKREGD